MKSITFIFSLLLLLGITFGVHDHEKHFLGHTTTAINVKATYTVDLSGDAKAYKDSITAIQTAIPSKVRSGSDNYAITLTCSSTVSATVYLDYFSLYFWAWKDSTGKVWYWDFGTSISTLVTGTTPTKQLFNRFGFSYPAVGLTTHSYASGYQTGICASLNSFTDTTTAAATNKKALAFVMVVVPEAIRFNTIKDQVGTWIDATTSLQINDTTLKRTLRCWKVCSRSSGDYTGCAALQVATKHPLEATSLSGGGCEGKS